MSQPNPTDDIRSSCLISRVETYLTEIKDAQRLIADRVAVISALLSNHARGKLLSNQTTPLSSNHHEDGEPGRSYNNPSTRCCPDCGKETGSEQALVRHYGTHVMCGQISETDLKCASCGKGMKTASVFFKSHSRCSVRMAGQLTESNRVEASRQKRRIKNVVVNELRRKMKRQNRGDGEQGLNVDTEVLLSLWAHPVSTLPNTTAFPGTTDLPGATSFHTTTDFSGTMDLSTTAFPDVSEEFREYYRESVVVQNPMDGAVDWNVNV